MISTFNCFHFVVVSLRTPSNERARSNDTVRDEGEEQKCRPVQAGKGERRVPGAGEAAATAERDHVTAGQGVDHTADDVVPEDARRIPGR